MCYSSFSREHLLSYVHCNVGFLSIEPPPRQGARDIYFTYSPKYKINVAYNIRVILKILNLIAISKYYLFLFEKQQQMDAFQIAFCHHTLIEKLIGNK